MSKIKNAFAKGKALIAFITCGDPDLETTAGAIRAAARNGADIIELGIPFSDPTAEGPVVQEANIRALAGGVTSDKVFEMAKGLRKDVDVPMIITTYANVVFSYGLERFACACREVGIDGVLLPEAPYEEKSEFQPVFGKHGVEFISMAAPAEAARIAMIAKEAEGFVYIAPCAGMSGAIGVVIEPEDIAAIIKKNSDAPCAVALDSPTAEQAAQAANMAGGVIVSEALVELTAKYGKAAPEHIGEYVKNMKAAIM